MRDWMPIIGAILVLLVAGGVIWTFKNKDGGALLKPSPSSEEVAQLEPQDYPAISMTFTSDARYVTSSFSNLNAAQLEYNLIYKATVKKQALETGVNAVENVGGKSTFSQKQLLGSESSGKFTYHENIKDAVMELTLRDSLGRSIYTATYPFIVSSGSTIELTASE